MIGDARGYSLNVEVSNTGVRVLKYVGYRPDSFSPPIEKGRISPMYRVEVRQAGKWQTYPIGWCGTGIDDIALEPKTSATFAVWVKAGPWDAVRVGLPWHRTGQDKDAAPALSWSSEITRLEIRKHLPPLTPAVNDPQRSKTYNLRHADGDLVVSLLRGLFIVVDQQHPYAQFEVEETENGNSLIVAASPEHQAEIARVLALVDVPDIAVPRGPAQSAAPPAAPVNENEPLIRTYPIRHADGEAAVGVLRSLFLVVNHEIAYARFGYDARTHSLIAIASRDHQKQIAEVVELLETQPPKSEPAAAGGLALRGGKEDDPLFVYPLKHTDGNQLVAMLRSRFVVVNHQAAAARFAFDAQSRQLIVIASADLRAKIRAAIVTLDQPPG
jgi:hypothetical protein